MSYRRVVFIIGGLCIAGLLSLSAYRSTADDSLGQEANSELTAAAKNTLKHMQAVYEVGRADLEDVYRWSRRVVEADDFSRASVQEHLALMQELHKRVLARSQVGGEGGEAHILAATKYYVAEAEAFSSR